MTPGWPLIFLWPGVIWFAGAALFVTAMLDGARIRRQGGSCNVRANEWHHAYLGTLLVVIAVVQPLALVRAIGLWVGAVLTADDGYEHTTQIATPAYQSPLHVWFTRVAANWAWLRAVVAFLDRLFGKGATP